MPYRPATSEDLARLAKTGCTACHGAGRYRLANGRFDLCRCVAKHKDAHRLGVTDDKQVVIEVPDEPGAPTP